MNEQWINEMRQKLTDYQWPVPEVSWDEIDRAVAANKAREVRLFWLRRMAAAAVVFLIAGVGYWGLLRHKSEPIVEKQWAQEQPIENRSQGDISREDRNDVTSQTLHAFFDKRSGRAEHLSPREIQEPEIVTPVSVAEIDTLNTTKPTEKEQPYAVEEKAKRKHLDNRLTAKAYMSSSMSRSWVARKATARRASGRRRRRWRCRSIRSCRTRNTRISETSPRPASAETRCTAPLHRSATT